MSFSYARRAAVAALVGLCALVTLPAPAQDAAPRPRFEIVDIGALPGAEESEHFPGSIAGDVNNHGQVVGQSHAPGGQRPILWSRGTGLLDLGEPPGGSGGAYAINNRGEVVGAASSASGYSGFYWSRSTGMIEIPSLSPGGSRNPSDINNRGVVVGSANVNGQQQSMPGSHAFMWTPGGGIRDLGALPGGSDSTAAATNDHNEVAGYGNGDGVEDLVAIFWDRDGTPWNLDEVTNAASQGWHLQQAFGLNDHGDIVGWGYHDGVPRGFLLVSHTPEPGAVGLMLVAAGCCCKGGDWRWG